MKPVATTTDASLRVDIEVILDNQHAGGAYVASPTFSQYPFGWLRDGAFVAHAMDRAGRIGSAVRFHGWVAQAVERHAVAIDALLARGRAGEHPDEGEFLPARFALDGDWRADDWPSFQLDGYGQWLWSLARHAELAGHLPSGVLEAARRVAEYLRVFRFEPCYDAWEEGRTQLHTSTLASTAAGLYAAQRLLGGTFVTAAEDVQGFMERECVSVAPAGDPTLQGAPHFVKQVGARVVDASLLWLATPFELWRPSDPRIESTVRRIEDDLLVDGGLRRYASDTFYGGGGWVLLTAWLGWHYARTGRRERAAELLAWVNAQRDEAGHLPEQVAVSTTHPGLRRYWTERWGGVARPLLWSHAMTILLALDLASDTSTPSG
jgi:GH15 family glucan-1,4-alpha-glucosidase